MPNPHQGLSFQTQKALIELDRSEAQPTPVITNYRPGSSAAEDQARARGIPLEQLRREQDEQFRQLMLKRRQGKAGGGIIKGALSRLAKRLSPEVESITSNPRIIKEVGGQWYPDSIEGSIRGLLEPEAGIGAGAFPRTNLEVAQALGIENNPNYLHRKALNDWIEGPLTKYIKNQMGTEKDPVRLLARQGIIHEPPVTGYEMPAQKHRRKIGMPRVETYDSPAGDWEDTVDYLIDPLTIGEAKKRLQLQEEPIPEWLNNLPPKTQINKIHPGFVNDLGISHLTDELKNSLNPNSGLPRQFLLTPANLKQMGMEKAVRHVDAINKWREAQKVQANQSIANNAATMLHKDYPDKGFKWVELRQPDTKLTELPSGEELRKVPNENSLRLYRDGQPTGAYYGSLQDRLDELSEGGRYSDLEQALKYEGDTMGHCVGGYCDDVASGRSRIFSLRDAKGQPHVTIETSKEVPHFGYQDIFKDKRKSKQLHEYLTKNYPEYYDLAQETLAQYRSYPKHSMMANTLGSNEYWAVLNAIGKKRYPEVVKEHGWAGSRSYGDHPSLKYADELEKEMKQKFDEQFALPDPHIVQIKGKGNAKPINDYLPFVQDFVRSGKWSGVSDWGNTGLEFPDYATFLKSLKEP